MWSDHIEQKKDVLGSKPVIRNTRIGVDLILEKIGYGEIIDFRIAKALADVGYNIFSISKETLGITDVQVIEIATEKKGYIITEDKDSEIS